MMKRQPDGTCRNTRQASAVSAFVLRARWVEAEVASLKRMGLAFDAIAEQISRVGKRLAQAITPLPAGVTFPPDYTISKQACHKAFRRAIARDPALAADEFRKLDSARCEEMFLNLQPGIRKGNPRSVEAGVKVLAAYRSDQRLCRAATPRIDRQGRQAAYARPVARSRGANNR